MIKNKKSALELSINTIVIVVIAITILGLALYFTRNVFTTIGDDFFIVNEQLKSQIETALSQSDEPLYFPVTDIQVNKGDSKTFSLGIRNKNDATLRYKVIITSDKDQYGNPFSIDGWFQYVDKERSISPTENHIGTIKLIMPKDVASGSYLLTLEVVDNSKSPPDNIYAAKDFFIVVTS